MTAIVGLIENNTIYMGGDSAGVSGLSVTVRKDPKVFINGKFIFGFTTSFRMGQLLKYSFVPPDHPNNLGINRYMNTLFIDDVRKCFKEGGYLKTSNEGEEGGNFLVGYRGRLFNIDDDFQVGIPYNSYDAVGCGHDLCLGSLYTTDKFILDPMERVKIALEAATEFNGGVREPFNILSLEK